MKTQIKLFSFVILFFLYTNTLYAQLSFSFGGNISNVLHHHLFVNENGDNNKPLFGGNFGMSFQDYPFKKQPNMSFTVGLFINQYGYRQEYPGESFTQRLNYLSVPLLFNYDFLPRFSMNTGIAFSRLILPISIFEKTDNSFNLYDFSLLLGAEYKLSNQIDIFTRINYGVYPILDYYKIDNIGNITPVKDVRNVSLMLGLKYNIL